MIKNFEEYLLESNIPEPYIKNSPIVLTEVGCSADYNDDNKTISVLIPNGDEFVMSCQAFKWTEGYPKAIMYTHKRCDEALSQIKSGNIIGGMQNIFKMPYSPYLVYLFESDRPMLNDLRYVLDRSHDFEKTRIDQFIASLLENNEDEDILRKSDPEVFQFFKEGLVDLVIYLKCKCEIFFWFYQGLPQLSTNGIW